MAEGMDVAKGTAAASSASLGSEGWIGTEEYEPGGEFDLRARKFFEKVKWDNLITLCSQCRRGIECSLSERFSIGHFNMVRRVVFADGVSWVARLRMPLIDGDGDVLLDSRVLRSEVASMMFLRAKTTIPAPQVHSYDANTDNPVGAMFILMDYIHGTVAEELRIAKDCTYRSYGTQDQDQKFRQQMANIQVELSLFQFDQIGSLYYDEATGQFVIGPVAETGQGPWASSTDCYADMADQALRESTASAHSDIKSSWSFAVPVLFRHLISVYGDKGAIKGPFRLMNRDFGAHNLLVNDEFEIIGVIDLDGIMAAPIEMVAQYPVLTGLDRQPPGHVETRPIVLDRILKTAPLLEQYKSLVEVAEVELGCYAKHGPSISSLLLSDNASLFQGLREYSGHQVWVNDRWMDAYLRFIRRCATPE